MEKQPTNNKTKLSREIVAMVAASQADHFIGEGTTENTAHTVWRCSKYHPCKRTTCTGCQERRRCYFVDMGSEFAASKGLNRHCTITWKLQPGEDPWERLLTLGSMLSKRMTGKIGPFIRVLAVGEGDAPHVHYVISADFEDRFYKLAKDNSPKFNRVSIKVAYDIHSLLNYFFVMNFTPTVNDPRRIKGSRLISGSRGNITYSYPRTRHWEQYEELKARDDYQS